MAFCIHCGRQIEDDVDFCIYCGNKQNAKTKKAAMPSFTQKKPYFENMQNRKNIQQQQTDKNLVGGYVDENEKVLATIGSGYFNSFVEFGNMSSNTGVLTDKRLYYKGKTLQRTGNGFTRILQEAIVDIKDITASGFYYNRYILLLILAILVPGGITAGITAAMVGTAADDFLAIPIILGIILVALGVVAFIRIKRTIYFVEYAGGCLYLQVSGGISVKDVRMFNLELRRQKDHY